MRLAAALRKFPEEFQDYHALRARSERYQERPT